jgi:hypothetical protein
LWKGGRIAITSPIGSFVCSRDLAWFALDDLRAAVARFGIVVQKVPAHLPYAWALSPARWPSGVGGLAGGMAIDDPCTAAALTRASRHAWRLVFVASGIAVACIVLLMALEAPDIDWLNVAAGWTFGSLLSGAVVFLIAGPLRNRPLRLARHILALQPWYACEALVSDGDAPGTGRTVTFLHPATGVPMGRFAVESGWYGRWLQPMQRCWLLCANGTDGMPSIVAPASRSAFAHLTKVRRP